MDALRYFTFSCFIHTSLGLGVVQLSWAQTVPACVEQYADSYEEKPLLFYYRAPFTQRAFVDRPGHRNSYIEVEYRNGAFRFYNRMEGYGLASTIFHVRADVYTDQQQWLEPYSFAFPNAESCFDLSLFPEQHSVSFKLPRYQSLLGPGSMIQLRLWMNRH